MTRKRSLVRIQYGPLNLSLTEIVVYGQRPAGSLPAHCLQLTGYALAYEPFALGGAGELVLYRINPGLSVSALGSQQITLNTIKDYRFALTIEGTQLQGQVFEIGAGLVAEMFATDTTYASGFSGLIAYSQVPIPPEDVTWDNFSSVVPCAGSWSIHRNHVAMVVHLGSRITRGESIDQLPSDAFVIVCLGCLSPSAVQVDEQCGYLVGKGRRHDLVYVNFGVDRL